MTGTFRIYASPTNWSRGVEHEFNRGPSVSRGLMVVMGIRTIDAHEIPPWKAREGSLGLFIRQWTLGQLPRLRDLLVAVLVFSIGMGCGHRDERFLPGWQLVWADEFEGAHLDQRSWTAEIMPDPFNEELQYYTDRVDGAAGANAWLEDGALVIEARHEPFEHRQYTSARLITQGKREFSYGRFEARIRQPGETGMWPAFWLLGGNIDEVGWPLCGEIDVMEGKGRLPRWTSGALHRGSGSGDVWSTAAEYTLNSGSFHDEWHVFALEWEAGTLRWYVDDVLFHTVHRESEPHFEDWPFDEGRGFFLVLNLAVGGWFDAPHAPPEQFTPQRLEVDYVRVYRTIASGPDPVAD